MLIVVTSVELRGLACLIRMNGFNRLGWKQPQTQQVLAADTGVGPAKMEILRDAKNWEHTLKNLALRN